MRVVIAGAGSVGRSIAHELLAHRHGVTLIDRSPTAMRVASVADADWLLGDACEVRILEQAGLAECDVVVAATGDDKANLVLSLIAKTEFAVPRTVARVNNPKNEWMFDSSWGVDVLVSTPRIMTALVEEAVSVGDLVRIFSFHSSATGLYELVLGPDSLAVGTRAGEVTWPAGVALTAIVRDEHPRPPSLDEELAAGDMLIFIVSEQTAEREPAAGQAINQTPAAQLQALLGDAPEAT